MSSNTEVNTKGSEGASWTGRKFSLTLGFKSTLDRAGVWSKRLSDKVTLLISLIPGGSMPRIPSPKKENSRALIYLVQRSRAGHSQTTSSIISLSLESAPLRRVTSFDHYLSADIVEWRTNAQTPEKSPTHPCCNANGNHTWFISIIITV